MKSYMLTLLITSSGCISAPMGRSILELQLVLLAYTQGRLLLARLLLFVQHGAQLSTVI